MEKTSTLKVVAKSYVGKQAFDALSSDFSSAGGEQHLRFDGKHLHTHARFDLSMVDIRAWFGNEGPRNAMRQKAVTVIREALAAQYGTEIADALLSGNIKAVKSKELKTLKARAESMKAQNDFKLTFTQEFGHEISDPCWPLNKIPIETEENRDAVWKMAIRYRKHIFVDTLKTRFGEQATNVLLRGPIETKEQQNAVLSTAYNRFAGAINKKYG